MNEYLLKDDSFASISADLVRKNYGNEVLEWDLETIWKTLSKDGVILTDISKAKISAFFAINVNPMVLWEVNTFQNTILAANNVFPIPEIVQECTPFELGWGLLEIRDYILRNDLVSPNRRIIWGDDIISYIAACLKSSGWFIAPRPLSMSQERLDTININTDLKPKILFEWGKISSSNLASISIEAKDEVSMQLKRLRDYHLYLQLKFKVFQEHKEKEIL